MWTPTSGMDVRRGAKANLDVVARWVDSRKGGSISSHASRIHREHGNTYAKVDACARMYRSKGRTEQIRVQAEARRLRAMHRAV